MHSNRTIKSLLAVVFVGVPLLVQADNAPAPKSEETFQSTCVKAWLGRDNTTKDQVDYKNFGEQYCECAATQPLQDSAAVDKAAQVCMTRTLLHDALNSLEEDNELTGASEADIDESCHDRWSLVYPKMDDRLKQVATSYCGCAKSELKTLIKNSDNMTDKEYDNKINDIAASCAAQLAKSNSTESPAPQSGTTSQQ
ncbi:hypothetical protein DIZ81_05550 [Legionella taurinensis]|uniref:Uncharacterized protein n=1 Tax=Legionella taurinensis TaxID=70611 RepID=A0A3A5LGJ2_9GAMM|nr:hypothetical protein [Legionella taurinensis]MDX1837378.1 hypothetical protein [Legionella taurinensis]PUT40731.1 hypothetical protein DB744_05550 [Legionella taurinensis]PUT44153.1 hypothetical protein DB746_03950 [Legionella taurinensis]PUT47454.1 hypothetical protein DB743_02120 [Legionella taurinensis]PUT48593.1 hypothetical protein DB745_03950 [Legionella taurinensis]